MKFTEKVKQISLVLLTVSIGFCFAGPVAEFHFENDGADATGNGNNATYENVNFVPGIEGLALDYGFPAVVGANFSVADNNALDLNTMTLEAWFAPSFPFTMNIVTKWGGADQKSYALNLVNGVPTFTISPDGKDDPGTSNALVLTSTPYPGWQGAWNHIAATFDGITMRLYLNGAESASLPVPPGFTPWVGTAPLRIGVDGNDNAPMKGLIDYVRINSTALSAAEIADHYAEFFNTNKPPVAAASFVQTGRVITLDGSGSSDPDGDDITYLWTLITPEGSTAELSDATAVSPVFNMDLFGDYTVQLVVTDINDAESDPVELIVSPFNAIPVADAGPDQAISVVGTPVQLDGSGSSDNDAEDNLYYQWEIISKPEGSNVLLDDPESVSPSFIPDEYGTYTISLVVNDGWDESPPDEVIVSFDNIKPVANAGENQSCVINEAVVLTGSGSDDNGDEIAFLWQIVSAPEGSEATIQDETDVEASIVPDVPGEYVISLTVNDGTLDSDPSLVSIVAISYSDALTETLKDAIAAVKSIPKYQFRCKRLRRILTKVLYINMLLADRGRYRAAYIQLSYGILRKLDGCERRGRPDRNDWIRNCEAQGEVYPILIEAKELLAEILGYH